MDGKYISPGGLLFYDGKFHMLRNGFADWPGLVSISYQTSTDGLNWIEEQAEPVFASAKVHFVGNGDGADFSSSIILEDGTWVLYFHRVSDFVSEVIGQASAPSPLGPWQVDPDPILLPGGEGVWDEGGVARPGVIRTDDGFAMFYSGYPHGYGDTMIGQATSTDGITWRKYDDISTADLSYAESDPVLKPEEDWTTGGVDRAHVVIKPDELP